MLLLCYLYVILLKDAQGNQGRRGQAITEARSLSERRQRVVRSILTSRDYFKREGSESLVVEKPCDTHSTTNYDLGLGVSALPLMCSVTYASHFPFLALRSPYVNWDHRAYISCQDMMKFDITMIPSTFLCKWAITHESHLLFFPQRVEFLKSHTHSQNK